MYVVLPVPQHLALSTTMSSWLVCCDVACLCTKQVVYFTVHVCHFPYSVLPAESSREKERGEFSMLSTVDMCAPCSAFSSVYSTGVVEDKRTTC